MEKIFKKKFGRGRTKAENRADRGGGCRKFGRPPPGKNAGQQV
jgi:hypothetical protein